MANDPTLRHPSEWEEISGVQILDPDGWDRANFDVSWNALIDEEEWLMRMSYSTCGFYAKGRLYMESKKG